MDPDHKREQPGKPNDAESDPTHVPLIYRKNRIAVHDLHGDLIPIFTYNLLLACSSNKFIRLHVLEDGAMKEYIHPVALKEFAVKLPPEMFWHQGRFHAVNVLRLTRISRDHRMLQYDYKHYIKLRRKVSTLLDNFLDGQH